jgi:hypothetical protein
VPSGLDVRLTSLRHKPDLDEAAPRPNTGVVHFGAREHDGEEDAKEMKSPAFTLLAPSLASRAILIHSSASFCRSSLSGVLIAFAAYRRRSTAASRNSSASSLGQGEDHLLFRG